ncbi:Imm21 family immunity protein [Actinomadura litoris]|nr:Imm21 family immunity protein [Actinomadura litoris]
MWVETQGGPLILVPESVLLLWKGSSYSEADKVEEWGDYGRACGVGGHAGVISVGTTEALVLAEEPAATSYVEPLGMLVRLLAGFDFDIRILEQMDLAETIWDPVAEWKVDGALILFDPVLSGSDVSRQDSLRISLREGRIIVEAARGEVEPDDDTALQLLRLRYLDCRARGEGCG